MIDNKWIKLQIWDTAGQERFRTITSGMYLAADKLQCVLVYLHPAQVWLTCMQLTTEVQWAFC